MELGRFAKGLSSLLVELLRPLILQTLPLVVGLQPVLLPILGGFILVSGGMFLAWSSSRREELTPSDRRIGELASRHIAFARWWMVVGALLSALGMIGALAIPVTVAGAFACLLLHRRAQEIGEKIAARQALRGRRLVAGLGLFLKAALTCLACAGVAYAALATANVGHELAARLPEEHEAPAEPSEPDPEPGKAEQPPPPRAPEVAPKREELSYAEQCRKLPNPLDIPYGLGWLFKRKGATFAGCGERVIGVGKSGWASAGMCGPEVRSLAYVRTGRKPVMIFAAAAEFALRRARRGDLLSVEVADGEGQGVVLIGTREGTFVFTYTSSPLHAMLEDPVECREVEQAPSAMVEIPPPMASLWLRHMRRWQAWSWPQAGSNPGEFVLEAEGAEGKGVYPAYGRCEEDGSSCRLDAPGEHPSLGGSPTMTLAELEVWMPTWLLSGS